MERIIYHQLFGKITLQPPGLLDNYFNNSLNPTPARFYDYTIIK